jgi:polyisoprenoid-binding protein YceI
LFRWIAVIGIVAVGAAAFGFWYYFVRDDEPPPATLVDRPTVPDAAASGADGTWTVEPGDDTFAGYRITEHFSAVDNTAVVRTAAVTGTMTISGRTVSAVEVTADLTKAESKDAQPPGVFPVQNRIGQMENDGLETARFPTSTFVVSEPIELARAPEAGVRITAEARGDLTIHGVTKSVTVPIEARWNGEVIDVTGSLPIVLADYGITPPERNFVSVDDRGTMEFQLTFVSPD